MNLLNDICLVSVVFKQLFEMKIRFFMCFFVKFSCFFCVNVRMCVQRSITVKIKQRTEESCSELSFIYLRPQL